MSKKKTKRLTQTAVIYRLLRSVAPGEHDEALDDVEIRGPRGGMLGYAQAPGVFHPQDQSGQSNAMITRVVHLYADEIHHGESYHWEHGSPGHFGKTTSAGITLPDSIRCRAIVANYWDPDVVNRVAAGDVAGAVELAVERYRENPDTRCVLP